MKSKKHLKMALPMVQTLTLHSYGAVLWAKIDRPQVHNAINFEVMADLAVVIDFLNRAEDIRVFVLSGAGNRFFAAGGDLKAFAELTTAADATAMSERMGSILNAIACLDCWTIACLNGDAYGGGWETALAFDFRVMSRTAKIGFTQRRFSLTPGWGGMTRLTACVGRSRALQWLAEGALIDASAALAVGLVNRVEKKTDLIETTLNWAQKLGEIDRYLIRALKCGTRQTGDFERAIQAEVPFFAQSWAHPRHHEAVVAFMERSQIETDSAQN